MTAEPVKDCEYTKMSLVTVSFFWSPRGLAFHMQIFEIYNYLILQKNEIKLLKGRLGLCEMKRWSASPDIRPLVHTVYSVRNIVLYYMTYKDLVSRHFIIGVGKLTEKRSNPHDGLSILLFYFWRRCLHELSIVIFIAVPLIDIRS